jgi:hypothetical protein
MCSASFIKLNTGELCIGNPDMLLCLQLRRKALKPLKIISLFRVAGRQRSRL